MFSYDIQWHITHIFSKKTTTTKCTAVVGRDTTQKSRKNERNRCKFECKPRSTPRNLSKHATTPDEPEKEKKTFFPTPPS